MDAFGSVDLSLVYLNLLTFPGQRVNVMTGSLLVLPPELSIDLT